MIYVCVCTARNQCTTRFYSVSITLRCTSDARTSRMKRWFCVASYFFLSTFLLFRQILVFHRVVSTVARSRCLVKCTQWMGEKKERSNICRKRKTVKQQRVTMNAKWLFIKAVCMNKTLWLTCNWERCIANEFNVTVEHVFPAWMQIDRFLVVRPSRTLHLLCARWGLRWQTDTTRTCTLKIPNSNQLVAHR